MHFVNCKFLDVSYNNKMILIPNLNLNLCVCTYASMAMFIDEEETIRSSKNEAPFTNRD